MSEETAVVLIVSRLGTWEQDFFPSWGTHSPDASPYAVFISEQGSMCTEAEARVVLVRGDAKELPQRVVSAAKRVVAEITHAHLLVHTGGESFSEALRGRTVPAPMRPDWEALRSQSFSWSTGYSAGVAGLGRFLRELATYATGEVEGRFKNALLLLWEALSEALQAHPGKADQAEARSEAAWRVLQDPDRRRNAGLADREPSQPPRNPVAALIHDAVSRFDTLLIDLQVAIEDPTSWQEDQGYHKGSIGSHLEQLSRLMSENDADIQGLKSVPRIVHQIEGSDTTTADERRLLHAMFERLAVLMSTPEIGELLAGIDEGAKDEVTKRDAEVLQTWLNDVRQQLAFLDKLYKLRVLRLGADQVEQVL